MVQALDVGPLGEWLVRSWGEAFAWVRCDLRQRGAIREGVGLRVPWLWVDPINRFMLLLRLNELSRNTRALGPFAYVVRYLYRRASLRLSFSIPPNVFGPGLAIVHYGTIVVNGGAKVGKNCRIHVGVNIGASGGLSLPGTSVSRAPRLGDNVYIAPGAKIYGPIEIADGCVIGANAVVNKSFNEQGVTIAGVPARVIAKRSSKGMIAGGRDGDEA